MGEIRIVETDPLGMAIVDVPAVAHTPDGRRLLLPEGTLIRFVSEGATVPGSENTGLECPDCGAKQKRVDCQIMNGSLFARLSLRVDSQRELQGVWSLLKMFLPQLPKGGSKK